MEDQDKADLRRAVRAHLAERPKVAQSAATIHRHLGHEFGASIEDVENACAFLSSLKHLEEKRDPLGGSETYYRATAEGILAHERGQ